MLEKVGVAPDMTLKCAGERTILALKPMGRVTGSPKQGQSVAPKMDLGPTKKFLKNFLQIDNRIPNLNVVFRLYDWGIL